MKNRTLAILALAASSLASGAALAVPVVYNGGVFDFYVSGTGAGTNQYYITYTADFTNYVAGSQTNIGGLQWMVGGDAVTAALLQSATTGTWDTTLTGKSLSGNGCTGNANGAVCVQSLSPYPSTTGVQTWVFLATFASPLAADFNETNIGNPIRMWFVDANGNNQGLMSCSTGTDSDNCTAVPEPGTLALLGLGLLGLGASRRRRA